MKEIEKILIYEYKIKNRFMLDSEIKSIVEHQKSLALEYFEETNYFRKGYKFIFSYERGNNFEFYGYAVYYGEYTVINCTAHNLLPTQKEELKKGWSNLNFVELDPNLRNSLMNCPPDRNSLKQLAINLIDEIDKPEIIKAILPIGSPAFMFIFAQMCSKISSKIIFSHSERISEEVPQPDGTIKKISTFNHVKFF